MISFELRPQNSKAEQVVIFRDGQEIARCALAERTTRLAVLGYQVPKAPQNGFTASGRLISRKIARLQQGGC
jgi:hypothetical protein